MSLSTLIGVLGALGVFLGSIFIATDNWYAFIDLPSFVMVFGGALTRTFIAYEPRYVIISLKLLSKVFARPAIGRDVLKAEVGRIIKWGYLVQKSGPQALEAEAKKSTKGDKFLQFGVEMVISGYSGEEIRGILTTTIETTYGRNMVPVKILTSLGAASPAFGMVGTLVGLIIMLGSMGADPGSLGKGMAVAMITTLYGVLLAQVIYMPVADKISQRESIMRFRNYLVAEGLVLLADRKSPRFIQDKMNSFLDPAIHFNLDKMKS